MPADEASAAAVAAHLRQMEALLTCDICGDTLRCPAVLPCKHAFCSECVRRHFLALTPHCECPTCREPVRNGVLDLRFCFVLEALAETTRRNHAKLLKALSALQATTPSAQPTSRPVSASSQSTAKRKGKAKMMATPGFLEEEENEQQDDDDDFAVMKPCPRTKQKVFVKSQTRQESIACQISPLLVPAAMQKEKRKAETHMTERGASGNAPGNTPIAKKTRSHATPASTGPESIFGEADQLFSCPICTKNVKNRHMDAHISSSCVHYIEKVAPASIMDSFARVSSPLVVVASLPDSSPIDLDFETPPRIVNSAKQFIPVESRLQPALRDLQTPHPNGLSQQPPIFAEAYDIEFDLPPTSPALLSFVNSTQVTVNEADGMEDEFGEAVDTCMSTTSERAFVAPVSAFLDEGEVTEDEAAQEDPDRKRKRESPSVSDSANDPRTGEKEQMPGQDERAESEAVTPESRERRLAARNAILADLTGSIVDARKPKPSVAYDTLKDAQLRRLLKDEGLRATGDKATLKRRHKEFTLLHNANLDSLHPKPQTAVLAAMVAWEKTHGELSSGAGSVASGLGASAAFQGHKASEDGVASDARHVKKYHGEFERMVEELRERKRRKVEAREKEMHSKDVQNS